MGSGVMVPYQSLVLSSFMIEIGKWKLFVALVGITAFGTWFGVAKPFLRSHVWDITNKRLEASHGYILGAHMNECTLLNNIMKSLLGYKHF
jgi:hypothetical protein